MSERCYAGPIDRSGQPRLNYRMLPVSEDLWQMEGGDLRMPGGALFPIASTVIRLPDRSLVVYSPIEFDDAKAAELAALGEVAHLVAPSRFHYLFMRAAAARWPRATVHASPGVAAKCPDLRIDRVLGRDAEPAWRDVLEVEHIGGVPKIDEVVLFHRPSHALVCADLVFHIARPPNLRARIVLAFMGAGGGKLAQSRTWGFLRSDRAAAQASVSRILAWPIERVVPCHGAPCAIDASGMASRLTRLAGTRVALPAPTAAPSPSA